MTGSKGALRDFVFLGPGSSPFSGFILAIEEVKYLLKFKRHAS